MSLLQTEKWEQQKEWNISISKLSENDKKVVFNFLNWENYIRKWEYKTDSIEDPDNFFLKLISLSKEEKRSVLNQLNEYFKNKEKIESDEKWIKKIEKEKEEQQKVQDEKIIQLKTELENRNNEKNIDINSLKDWWGELTKVINNISNLGLNWIWTTDEEKKQQINKLIWSINKNISDDAKEKIITFIEKSIDKMYLIKNKYLEWGKLSAEKNNEFALKVLWIQDTEAQKEFHKFIKECGSSVKIELKGPSIVIYIPRNIRKNLIFTTKHSVYWFCILESKGRIKNINDYNKIEEKYRNFGWIKCTDEQIKFDDLKWCVTMINADQWQFKSTEYVVEHEYQHVLNQGYLMPKQDIYTNATINKILADKATEELSQKNWVFLQQWFLTSIKIATDEILAGMSIEALTNELWLYNFYLEEIKTEKYTHSTPLDQILKDLKEDSVGYKEYQKKRKTHKEQVIQIYEYLKQIEKKTKLDKKTLANTLATQPINKRKEISESV